MTAPDGTTPSAPDVDQPEGGSHGGEGQESASGQTPSVPDADQPDGGDS